MRMHNPPHPGEVIREYLGEMSVTAAAAHLGVGRVTFSRVLNGKAAVSPEMAVRHPSDDLCIRWWTET